MKIRLKIWFLIFFIFLPGVSLSEEERDVEGDDGRPLRITIRPEYDSFDGRFSEGAAQNALRIENLPPCPRDHILSCDIRGRFWGKGDKIKAIIAAMANERSRLEWGRPSIGLILGGRYARLPDYKVLAVMGVDPGLEPLWPWPQPTGQMYGSLWFADTLNLGDRIAGPVMLIRSGPSRIELLGGERRPFSGF